MAQEQPARIERRLSAILAADVAGYSRLMHNDEEATHTKLTALFANSVAPAIAEHGGRIVKNTGDGFLAEFQSAVEAVRAAIQFPAHVKELTGITESLTTDLSRINGSFVIACNAAFTETEASVSTQRPNPILGRVYAIVRKLVAAGLGNSD